MRAACTLTLPLSNPLTLTPLFLQATHVRATDQEFADSETRFSDGFPILVATDAALDDLNSRMPQSLPITRFRYVHASAEVCLRLP